MTTELESADLVVRQEGTVTSIRPMRGSSSMQLLLNRRTMVVAPMGASSFFAGLRVEAVGVWRKGPRRRYLLASELRPLESLHDLSPERLARILIGVPEPTGEHVAVVTLLTPVLMWLWTSGYPSLAKKLARLTRLRAQKIVQNPYALIRQRELDFDSAEALYRRLHGDEWALCRLQAATTEVLRRAERAGRARIMRGELVERILALLSLPSTVDVDWEQVWTTSLVARDGDQYCLPSWYHQRRRVLQVLQNNNQAALPTDVVHEFSQVLSHRYVVLTGAAMSGKTTLLRALAAACRAAGWRVGVTAMTGKAASVIGPEAMTLHRLLGYSPQGYSKDMLPYDLVIIDEASMATFPILAAALKVIPGHIVFCLDWRQLPPVEGEAAFPDLLRVLPVHDLGVPPTVSVTTIRHWSIEHLVSNLARLCRSCQASGQGWQVLSPIKGTALGTVQLNRFLQGVMNPQGLPVGDGFRIGDRIIVIRNDYQGAHPVFNGQTGVVLGMADAGVHVRLENGLETAVAFRDLQLSYCLTVHKAQGSRFDTVVFVVPTSAKEFAEDARMQYVGMTRGRYATWCYAL